MGNHDDQKIDALTPTRGEPSKIWGGRFTLGPADIMRRINVSIDFDKALYAQDIEASQAHCRMLVRQGIITPDDGTAIHNGLAQICGEIEQNQFEFKPELEDIHMNIENRLSELIGEAAGRLHTARSRNDQVATDFRLWVRDALDHLDQLLQNLQKTLIDRAIEYHDTIMPGFTHLQAAQPITMGHHLLCYVEMFGRDRLRLKDARERLNESPLGSAALAGTSYPIDREMTAQLLGFSRVMRNSLDGVSDRDFALEFMTVSSICAVHLSRLAEELVLWTSVQFGFVRLSDAFSTGSSIMPQKRNPDAAELIRGKTGRVIGCLTGLLIAMKGLPLAYSKDMQEDKEPVFEIYTTMELSLCAMAGMINDMQVNIEKCRSAAENGFMTATDLADWCVRVLQVPFRYAHHVAGQLVKMAEEQHCHLSDLSLVDMQKVEPRLTQEALTVLDLRSSVQSRKSFGGTAPDLVLAAAHQAQALWL